MRSMKALVIAMAVHSAIGANAPLRSFDSFEFTGAYCRSKDGNSGDNRVSQKSDANECAVRIDVEPTRLAAGFLLLSEVHNISASSHATDDNFRNGKPLTNQHRFARARRCGNYF